MWDPFLFGNKLDGCRINQSTTLLWKTPLLGSYRGSKNPLQSALKRKLLTNELKLGENEEKRHKLIPTSHDSGAYNNIVDGNKDSPDDSSSLTTAYRYFEQRLKQSP